MKSLQNKVNSQLKKLKDDNKLDYNTYLSLRAQNANIPLFYALIKTHKPNYPIRPIVNFIDSPTYNFAKFISKLLKPTCDLSILKIKNTLDVKTFLQS